MKLLFLGDVVGRPGRRALQALLPSLRRELGADVVIANGENLAGGSGLTRETAAETFASGVDILTGGNHLFDKKDSHAYIAEETRIARPANFPPGTPGTTLVTLDAPGGLLAVGSLLGRIFMRPLDDPFRAAQNLVRDARDRGARYTLIDMHAEATSEKIGMGWFLDGKVSAVIGTHTHVPTADARVLPGGTAYVTDAGMTGPFDSVIGMEKEPVLAHFLTGLHHRFHPAARDIRLQGLFMDLDEETGLAHSIERVERRLEENTEG